MKYKGVMALEAIAFQNDELFDEVTKCFKMAWDAGRGYHTYKDMCNSDAIKKMLAAIHKRTGVNLIMCMRYPDDGPAIIPHAINPNHVFYDDSLKGHPELLDHFRELAKQTKGEVVTGSVDLKNARVTGFFTDVEHELLLPTSMMMNGYLYGTPITAEEAAAIVLHELGHAFTYFEMMTRTARGNCVLGYLAQQQAGGVDKYKVAVATAGRALGLTKKQEEALEKAKSKEDTMVMVLAFNGDVARSELGYDLYDATSCEQMADQFATRMGAGMHLITALEKIGGLEQWKNRHKHTWILELLLYTAILAGGFAAGGIILAYAVFWTSLNLLLPVLFANIGWIYDDAEFRPARVMNELVDRLKDRELTSNERTALIENITQLKQIVADKKGYDSLADYLKLLRPSYRRNRDSELLQKQLEALAANHLFVHAAKLQSLND